MLIAYTSMTGNVRRFITPLSFPTINLKTVDRIDEPYILVTYTFHWGGVPQEVTDFLKRSSIHQQLLQGVAASGNRNWGSSFAKAAERISYQYHVPIIHKFELAGTEEDREIFTEKVRALEQASRNQCSYGS